MTVLGQSADSYALSVSSANGTDAVSGSQGTANAQAGSSQQWVVQYSGASGVVVVAPSTGVGSQQDDARLVLFVRPNPTTGPASISFTVPLQSDVSLSVFDLQGRLVQRLVNASMSAGLHNTTWDGRDASGQKVRAGVYLMRLAVAGRRTTQRVVFVP